MKQPLVTSDRADAAGAKAPLVGSILLQCLTQADSSIQRTTVKMWSLLTYILAATKCFVLQGWRRECANAATSTAEHKAALQSAPAAEGYQQQGYANSSTTFTNTPHTQKDRTSLSHVSLVSILSYVSHNINEDADCVDQ